MGALNPADAKCRGVVEISPVMVMTGDRHFNRSPPPLALLFVQRAQLFQWREGHESSLYTGSDENRRKYV